MAGTAGALGLAAAVPIPVQAEELSRAAQLRQRFEVLKTEASEALGQAAGIRDDWPARFACPPEEPNKEGEEAEIRQVRSRIGRALLELRQIDDARLLLGRAGEGQVSQGAKAGLLEGLFGKGAAQRDLIDETEIADLRQTLENARSGLERIARELAARPATRQDCDPRRDPIAAITWNAPSRRPGTNVNAAVSATTRSGAPVNISAVTVIGIDEIGTAGLVGGLGTANATYGFRIADVRRHGPFTLYVEVSGVPVGAPAGSPPISHRIRVTYDVANAPPVIVSAPTIEPAEPGESLTLSGQLVVRDSNADSRNVRELRQAAISLSGHPAGLETVPGDAFSRFQRVRLVSHDPGTGEYVFDIERPAAARDIHPHGTHSTEIIVTDAKGAEARKTVDIRIENVAPELTYTIRPRRHFHSGDGQMVTIAGRVRDRNGADDIAELELDASRAGGTRYTLGSGTIRRRSQGASEDGFGWETVPQSFGHTDERGEHPITGEARDGGAPEQGRPDPLKDVRDSSITVTNLAPEIGAIGFLTNFQMIPGRKEVCPRDLIRVGAQVEDPEGDALRVEAVIVETGETTELAREPGARTYTGHVLAPARPGNYTIEFRVVESDRVDPQSAARSIELIVKPCGPGEEEEEQPPIGAVDDLPPITVAGPPGSEVKVTTPAPALPGETPVWWNDVFQYARLLKYAALVDDLNLVLGGPTKGLPITLGVLDLFYKDMILGAPAQLLEDGGGGGGDPDDCGFGDGEGPVFNERLSANVLLRDVLYDAFEESLFEFLETEGANAPPDAVQVEIDREYEEWIDREFGERAVSDAAPAAQEVASAERARLQSKFDDLAERQSRIGNAIRNINEAIEAVDDPGDRARLRGQKAELEGYADAISQESTDLATRLNGLDADRMNARTELRTEISQRVNQAASEAIAGIIGEDASLQDIKDNVTWGTRWLSLGSKMQYETSRTTRTADRELAAAGVKLEIVEGLLDQAAPGTDTHDILNEMKQRYERQKTAAEQLLGANAALSAAGYVSDVGLIVSGGLLAKGLTTLIGKTTAATLGQQASARVVTAVSETGITQLAKNALGRGGAEAAAATGTSAVATQATSRVAQESLEAAANASRTGALTRTLENAGMKLSDEIETVGEMLRRLADDVPDGTSLRQAATEIERLAAEQFGGNQWRALEHLESLVLDDVLQIPRTPVTEAVAQAMDDAVYRARQFTKPLTDWVDDVLFESGSGAQWVAAVPFLVALLAQEGSAAEPAQAKIGSSGRAKLSPEARIDLSGETLELAGGGHTLATMSVAEILASQPPAAQLQWQLEIEKQKYSGIILRGARLGTVPNNDFCRIKKGGEPGEE